MRKYTPGNRAARRSTGELADDHFVRVLVDEAPTLSPSALSQLAYLLQRKEASRRFRFELRPFLGMRAEMFSRLVQAAQTNVLIGNNGLPPTGTEELRQEIRSLLRLLPRNEDELRLVAVADFLRRSGWDRAAKVRVSTLVKRVQPQVAPTATMTVQDVFACLESLGLGDDPQPEQSS
jgi:hypothetical protein